MELLDSLDSRIFLFFNGMHTPFTDSFMQLFSGRFIWVWLYGALLFMVVKSFSIKKSAVVIIGIALAITLADQTCATLIRPMCERLRPSNPANPLSEFTHIVDGYRGGAYGFPSCHAANSFALAVFMSLLFGIRRFSVAIFAWAAVNSYSRICLGVHYPGDLLVGAIIGSAIGAMCYMGVRLVAFKGKPRHEATGTTSVLFITHADVFTAVGIATVLFICLRSL